MKNTMITMLLCAAALLAARPAAAGDISAGAVPGTINYQGRLERDNAPITGTIHLYFRIYNSATATGTGACGAVAQPCLWQSPELSVTASQGIFSASLSPDISVFSGSSQLYLEVQVESDVLSPREPVNSVVYALVAKKLEDGANVTVSSITAGSQLVNGVIQLKGTASKICFNDNSCMSQAGLGSAVGGVTSSGDSSIESGTGGAGIMGFKTSNFERMRLFDSAHDGTLAIGTAAINSPVAGAALDVDGTVYVSAFGVAERGGGPVPFNGNIRVAGGRVTGANSEYLSIGESDNVIALVSGGSERMRVHSNGDVGVGLAAPSEPLHAAGNIRSNTGLRGGSVSVGGYTGWGASSNEVRAQDGSHLLLQQNTPYNVGIGTDTPREKLHVRGSVRSDYGIIAATGAFSGAVTVGGNFAANSGLGNTVSLSSTVIYGTLQVTGGIGSMAGLPAYLASTQTFSGLNTFQNQVTVSSDIVTLNRIGAGVSDFDFSGSKYLQVGDNKPEFANDNAAAYLVGGANANARLAFYRGATEAARLETQGGRNLALVVNGSTKTLADSTYYRVQNSVVWISTGYAGTPSIFVSSSIGNVGIGTEVMDPNWKLTVSGNLRISGSANGIIFPDGTTLTTAGGGSASAISNNNDAVVRSDADQNGGGDVVLQAGALEGLILKSNGNVGIGTLSPGSKLNIRGGDLVLGDPVNPYSGDSTEDLIVAGNIVLDGSLLQRSSNAAQFAGLIVPGNVYISTGTGARTGVGTNAPATLLDVNGNAQFGQGISRSTFTAAGALQLASPLAPAYGGTGISGAGGAPNRVLRTTDGASWAAGQAALTTDVSGVLPVANGGTNIAAYTTGDIVYASAAGALSRLADVGAGSVLISGGVNTAPSYGKVGLTTHVSGTLAAANGGTGISGAGGTSNRVLRTTNGTSWAAGQADLTTDVSGALPVGNGGTGATDAVSARSNLSAAVKGANNDITSIIGLTGPMRLYSRSMAQLQSTIPGSVGEMYFCNNCGPAKVVVSTGTAAGNFSDMMGGTFQ